MKWRNHLTIARENVSALYKDSVRTARKRSTNLLLLYKVKFDVYSELRTKHTNPNWATLGGTHFYR
jgi:hypothetical protein